MYHGRRGRHDHLVPQALQTPRAPARHAALLASPGRRDKSGRSLLLGQQLIDQPAEDLHRLRADDQRALDGLAGHRPRHHEARGALHAGGLVVREALVHARGVLARRPALVEAGAVELQRAGVLVA